VKKILFFLTTLSFTSAFAQVFGELLPGSSQLTYDERMGVHKLLGGANFVYQGNTFYCDSAFYAEKDKTVRAYGHVHLQKTDNINLFCDSLYYYSETALADLWGNVRAINDQYRLSTDSMSYNTKTEQGIYYHGGTIENLLQNEVLTSQIGHFHPKSQQYFFQTNVRYLSEELELTTDSLQFNYADHTVHFFGQTCILTPQAILEAQRGWYNIETESGNLVQNASIEQEARIIKADSLVYLPQEKIAQGFCNVYVYDTIDKMAFSGHYAVVDDSLHYSLLTDNALATKFQSNDTIHIHADTIYNSNDLLGNRKLTQAYHGVKLLGTSIQGVSDSLSYEKETDCIELHRKPILWAKNGELKGDSIRIYLDDSLICQTIIVGKATAVMELDSGNYYNQAGGNEIIANFDDNQLTTVRIVGNAQTIFFPEETSNESIPIIDSIALEAEDSIIKKSVVQIKRMGMNRFFASDITVHFQEGEVVGITYYQQPDGKFYPMDKIKEDDQFIDHFSTNYHRRPKNLEELFLPTPPTP